MLSSLLDPDLTPVLPPQQAAIQAQAFHPSGEWTPLRDKHKLILGYFEDNARQHPDHLALIDGQRRITYAELNRRANQIAHAILADCGSAPQCVAFFLSDPYDLAAAAIATWKANKFYVQLTLSDPSERLAFMLDNCQPVCILATAQHMQLVKQIAHAHISLIKLDQSFHNFSQLNPSFLIRPDQPIHISFTSGSTGQPKGVIHTQIQRWHDTAASNEFFHIGVHDRFLYLILGLEFFISIATGATLVAFNLDHLDLSALMRVMLEHGVTSARFKPTLFRRLADHIPHDCRFPQLRLLHMVGEAVYRKDTYLFNQHCDSTCIMVGTLGMSETLNYRYFLLQHGQMITTDSFPAGYAKAGMTMEIVDEAGKPVAVGKSGEILVKSRYMAAGYLNQPELTAQKFQVDSHIPEQKTYHTGDIGYLDEEGCVFFVGRSDDRLKIHGYTIEPAEVEKALLNFGLFKEVAVVAHTDSAYINILVAYVVCQQPILPTLNFLRDALKAVLPIYMIPARFEFLSVLPQLQNGKVNRRALKSTKITHPHLTNNYAAARGSLEQALVDIWQRVLDISPIGIHDHFLDLGGDSIRATQIITRVRNQFNIEISQQSLLAQPTIEKMALIIVQHQAKLLDKESIERLLNQVENNE